MAVKMTVYICVRFFSLEIEMHVYFREKAMILAMILFKNNRIPFFNGLFISGFHNAHTSLKYNSRMNDISIVFQSLLALNNKFKLA